MIALSYADAFFIYLLLWMCLFAFLGWKARQRQKKHYWQITNTNLFHCDRCHHIFVPSERLNLCRCPRCNAVCIRKKRRAGE